MTRRVSCLSFEGSQGVSDLYSSDVFDVPRVETPCRDLAGT